ncbi:hypothetical protein ACWCL1_08730 [Ligilactobacillus sp. LYQ135]|nr:hypothetical protein [uncultured Ligilactobacillus sp.]
MNNQKKKVFIGIGGLIVLVAVIIGGIFGIKHYMIEQTYEKPINAVIKDEHENLHNNWITSKNSKIVVYDDPDEGNDYLITVTSLEKGDSSTYTEQYIVDKETNHVEYQDEILPVSDLKKLYEINHLKE